MLVADSPISTNDDKLLYFNTISDLAYTYNGHGTSLTEYPNQFIMALTWPVPNKHLTILFKPSY